MTKQIESDMKSDPHKAIRELDMNEVEAVAGGALLVGEIRMPFGVTGNAWVLPRGSNTAYLLY